MPSAFLISNPVPTVPPPPAAAVVLVKDEKHALPRRRFTPTRSDTTAGSSASYTS